MPADKSVRSPPSARWSSYDAWDYDGMKERLERFMSSIDKVALTKYAEAVLRKSLTMSEPFSAGQYWCCFELMSADAELVIARVRLPRHPDSNENVDTRSESYAIECEVATMKFVEQRANTVPSPRLYAYEGLGTAAAAEVGATFMLIEGIYGNTLQDVKFDLCELPLATQERIFAQWTAVQTELASLTLPCIGSIQSISDDKHAILGPLSCAVAESIKPPGPFHKSVDYFAAIGDAKYRQACKATSDHSFDGENDGDSASIFLRLGPYIFQDIVANTTLYSGPGNDGPFPLNHMDMGTQNILVDDDFNFLAIIDWEFAQSVPWEVNVFPMPFPLLSSDTRIDAILANPDHIAYGNMSRQVTAQKLYRQKFTDAELALEKQGRPLGRSIADVLNSPASRIYAVLEKLGDNDETMEGFTYEMVRLAFGVEGDEAREYVRMMQAKMLDQEVAGSKDGE